MPKSAGHIDGVLIMNAREINANAVVISAIQHPQNTSFDGRCSTSGEMAAVLIEIPSKKVGSGLVKNKNPSLKSNSPESQMLSFLDKLCPRAAQSSELFGLQAARSSHLIVRQNVSRCFSD